MVTNDEGRKKLDWLIRQQSHHFGSFPAESEKEQMRSQRLLSIPIIDGSDLGAATFSLMFPW